MKKMFCFLSEKKKEKEKRKRDLNSFNYRRHDADNGHPIKIRNRVILISL